MKTRTVINLGFAATYFVLGVALIHKGSAADPPASAPERQVDANVLLARVTTTLHEAKSITAEFEENDTFPGPYKDLAQRGKLSLTRPGRLRIDIKRYRRVTSADPWTPSGNDAVSVSDGATYTYAFLHPHSTQVRTQAVSPDTLRTALKLTPTVADFFSEDAGATFDHPTGPVRLLPQADWEGEKYNVVEFPVNSGEHTIDARAYIGTDNLVHRLIYRTDTPKGAIIKEFTVRNVRVNADIPETTFAYTAPSDATPLDTSKRPPLLAAGDVAPDFTVAGADGNPVELSDFRGKTVVLDFWATWCWPCNQSLPHTEAVVRSNHDKNVVAIAIAIWDSKPGFDAWVAKHNYPDIDFAFDPSPQGKDVGTALYHVTTTPTAYVIGPDGKIVSAIQGYTGPSDELQAAIDAGTGKTAQADR